MQHVTDFNERGYAVVRGIFDSEEIAEIAGEMDRLKTEARKHHTTFRHQNVLYFIDEDPRLGCILRFVHWPAYVSPVLERYRVDLRMLHLLEPLVGDDLKQVGNQISWKPPGGTETGYSYHQDCRFRRPASAYRDLGNSYVQTAIAIDPHGPENGCLRMYPASHRLGDLRLDVEHSILEAECDEENLQTRGLDPSHVVDMILEPGDVVLWHQYTIHGSRFNRSTMDRRTYLNGYAVAANCDRGAWAFRDGQPCQLGEPVLIQYEDLYTRPEPHYVVGAPYPITRE